MKEKFKITALVVRKKEADQPKPCEVVIFRNGHDPVLFNATEKDVGDAIICA